MNDYADLEIGLHRLDGVSWRVELRYSQAKADVDVHIGDRPLQVDARSGRPGPAGR